ncbi:MAG: hypothetical protein AB8B64_12230 [Granulosicoccus sp.]
MDARALLAIVLLLWLIRSWVNWDIQEKKAAQSRMRLRNRLSGSMSRGRGEASQPGQMSVSNATVAVGESAPGTADKVGTSPDSGRKKRIQEQLYTLEAQAKALNQSDLEIRRLRSELESMPSEGANIEALEVRVREQQSLMSQSVEPTGAATADKQALSNAPERTQETSYSADGSTEDKSDSSVRKTPLYQAPSEKDDLKLIKGIGPVMERTLNELGVTTFKQLANFNQDDIDKVSEAIGAFSGRIERDDWVGKAQKLVSDKSSA